MLVRSPRCIPPPPRAPRLPGAGYKAWCCPCLVAGDVADFAGNSWWMACLCQCACPCMHPLVTGPNRSQLKLVLGIEDNEGRPYQNPNRIWDQCLHLLLPCCSLVQARVHALTHFYSSCMKVWFGLPLVCFHRIVTVGHCVLQQHKRSSP
jgi:hypothetical protein